jgi:two-component system phosphate regulon sensor histidine kinase PhoR
MEGVDALCKSLGRKGDVRLTAILPDGTVAGDTELSPATMENHADRPEIADAYRTGEGRSTRFSVSVGETMTYAALRLRGPDGNPTGVLRASVSLSGVDEALRGLYGRATFGGFVVAVIAAITGLYLSRRMTRPLVELEKAAERYSLGEFGTRLPEADSLEVSRLTLAMETMARDLSARISELTSQRNEQEAILSSMTEGVLAVDRAGNLININRAAAGMLSVDPEDAKGRKLIEVVRAPGLTGYVTGVLGGDAPRETELELGSAPPRTMQVHGAPLKGPDGSIIGALVVLNDITRLMKLERMRRDFVANVSHELRTPITSIKGFAENLADGEDDPGRTEKFAGIILNQANRLNEIITDLMSLSKIEREAGDSEIVLMAGPVADVIHAAVQATRFRSDEKGISVEVVCAQEISAMLNPPLLEQAVVNLIDNAIKYSESGKPVRVSCRDTDGGPVIVVSDEGAGIESKHFPRIFERFYRVDKARSRKVGGTGLGLAIVKHIAQAHGGDVEVSSAPGKGSTFTIRLNRPS